MRQTGSRTRLKDVAMPERTCKRTATDYGAGAGHMFFWDAAGGLRWANFQPMWSGLQHLGHQDEIGAWQAAAAVEWVGFRLRDAGVGEFFAGKLNALPGLRQGSQLSASDDFRFSFEILRGTEVAWNFWEFHHMPFGRDENRTALGCVVSVTAFLQVGSRSKHLVGEDERKAVPVCAGKALLRKGLSTLAWGDKPLRVSEQNTVGVLLDVIASEVLGNVSLKLSDLADGNRLAVTPLRFSEHPLPVNSEDGIELRLAVRKSVGLDAHELQTPDNCEFEWSAFLVEQSPQDARVLE